MKRIVIKLSSPSEDNRLCERLRVASSPMKELNNGSGELQIADEVQRRAVSPTKIENLQGKVEISRDLTEDERYNQLNDFKSAVDVNSNSNDGVFNASQTYCKQCGKGVELDDFEAEFDATRKELEAKKCEIDEIKTKLEDELFERLALEDEFAGEKDRFEQEITSLKTRIQQLEGETVWKIEDLENDFRVLTVTHENAEQEIGHLKVMLERTVSENGKLRNDESIAEDRVVDIQGELETWKKKAQENADRGNTSRSILEEETAFHENEMKELREALNEMGKTNEVLSNRLKEFENDTCDCKKRQSVEQSDEYEDSLNDESIQVTLKTDQLFNSTREKHILELSSELNDMYREHIGYQEQFLELQGVLVTKDKELDVIRNEFEGQNIELQNYKQKYAESKDVIMASCQDNAHLRNRLEKRCKEFTELKKKFIVTETETSWLRDALEIVRTHSTKTSK